MGRPVIHRVIASKPALCPSRRKSFPKTSHRSGFWFEHVAAGPVVVVVVVAAIPAIVVEIVRVFSGLGLCLLLFRDRFQDWGI